ncbi:GIN domain-containing protein [Myroides pelagicus]|uniref:Putative auto-transporter adhesin head GIN domain-containing protein n=1 Tax=Myroides pelagicus TaxID=270914 RepID=A0A7K1GKQ7_9FLAO|nr:DUF2807 domain-containing protein [Myroides pelagicus]MTH29472.1 hypothetical protein [Myroides pelagicus]
MMRFIISFFLTLVALVASAQETKFVSIQGDIKTLSVSYPMNVYIDADTSSDQVKIEANSEVMEYIVVKQVGQKLTVALDHKDKKRGGLTLKTVNIYISQQGIEKFVGEAAAKIVVEGRGKVGTLKIGLDSGASLVGDFQATSVQLNLDSSSRYEGDISATKLKGNIDSAAIAKVTGDVKILEVDVDSMGQFEGSALIAKEVYVKADSMGKAKVYPTEQLNASADSMGSIEYYNTPKILNTTMDSMGTVKKK